jgi:hypothetical protein
MRHELFALKDMTIYNTYIFFYHETFKITNYKIQFEAVDC